MMRSRGAAAAATGLALLFAGGVAGQSRPAAAPARRIAIDIQVAQVDRSGTLCMRSPQRPLPAGARIWLVQPDTPQRLGLAEPATGSARCAPWADATADLVPLRVLSGPLDSMRLFIALVSPARPPRLAGGRVRVDLDGDGRTVRFGACTSGEGVYLTAWSGRSLTGRLRWHAYHYLGYDVDPSCSDAETREVPGTGRG